jgi:hypothetical protein
MTDDPEKADVAPASVDEAASAERARLAAPASRTGKPAEDGPRLPKRGSLEVWLSTRRTALLVAAFLAPCAVIVVSIWSIARDTARHDPGTPTTGNVAAARVEEPFTGVAAGASSGAAPLVDPGSQSAEFYDETDDGEPSPAKSMPPKRYGTVQQAAAQSCSTASVDGLSRQIIEQARCIEPNAFVPLPARPNLALAPNVFPYLALEARDHLLRALDAHPSGKMTVNSALRTVAQQYLVSRWSTVKRCGVQLATRPGESNHEVGAALDIAEPAQWRSTLEAHQFRWLGASDRVHFDYKEAAAASHTSVDVLAFQVLWNRNNPRDVITADGRYSSTTEQRLKKAPPSGFPVGPTCGKAAASARH